jgi:EAL domain-containing protein (putative c-di-GMP-specific phosphodiesterase class I)
VVQLARIFKLQAVVEGIEDGTYLGRLEGTGCDFGQRFHFAKPLRADDVTKLVAEQSQMVAPRLLPAASHA